MSASYVLFVGLWNRVKTLRLSPDCLLFEHIHCLMLTNANGKLWQKKNIGINHWLCFWIVILSQRKSLCRFWWNPEQCLHLSIVMKCSFFYRSQNLIVLFCCYMVSDCSFERFFFVLMSFYPYFVGVYVCLYLNLLINIYSLLCYSHSHLFLFHSLVVIFIFIYFKYHFVCLVRDPWINFGVAFKFNVNWVAVQAEFCLTLIVRIILFHFFVCYLFCLLKLNFFFFHSLHFIHPGFTLHIYFNYLICIHWAVFGLIK